MQLTNCLNCGAPLTDGVCGYCGTDWRARKKEPGELAMLDQIRGSVKLFGVEFDVNLLSFEAEPPIVTSYRDMSGHVVNIKEEGPYVTFIFGGLPKKNMS